RDERGEAVRLGAGRETAGERLERAVEHEEQRGLAREAARARRQENDENAHEERGDPGADDLERRERAHVSGIPDAATRGGRLETAHLRARRPVRAARRRSRRRS